MKKRRGFGNVIMILIFLIGGGVLGYFGLRPIGTRLLGQPVSLYEVDYENPEGAYVKTTIYYIYDYFAETTEGSTVKSREYIIDGDDYYYIGMLADGKTMKQSDVLMRTSWDYDEYKIDYEELEVAQFEVVGTIERMPSDSTRFFHQYLGWSSMSKEEQEMFLPYYLVVGKVGGSNLLTALLCSGGALVCIFIGLKTLFDFTTGYDRAVKRFVTAANTPGLEEKVKSFLEYTPEADGIQISNEFIFITSGGLSYYLDYASNLIWAYKSVTTHRTNGIKTGTTYSLILKFMNKKTYTVSVKNENACHALLQRIAPYCPKAIYGYDKELEKLYNNNLGEFLNIRYYSVETTGETAGETTSPDETI